MQGITVSLITVHQICPDKSSFFYFTRLPEFIYNALAKRWQLEEALLHYGEALRFNPGYDEDRLNFLSIQLMLNAK